MNATGGWASGNRENEMSAYVVSNNHINAIVRFMEANKPSLFDRAGRYIIGGIAIPQYGTAIGQLLLKENVRSVNYRYSVKDRAAKFVYDTAPPPVSGIEALKLINGLDYQSCERDDWHKSKACLILTTLKIAILEDLAGLNAHSKQAPIQLAYNDAAWSI